MYKKYRHPDGEEGKDCLVVRGDIQEQAVKDSGFVYVCDMELQSDGTLTEVENTKKKGK